MSTEPSKPTGPDLAQGIPVDDVADGGMVGGHVGEDAVLLARNGDEFFAIGSTCSHYGGPLADGLVVGDTVRCPWHHARFSLRTGEALGAPAFNPVPCWRVQKRDGKVLVGEKIEPADRRKTGDARRAGASAERVVIVGGGAAAFATAEMLRREAFAGSVTLLSSDDAAPYDRPNCSKDYLAGNAPEDWIPLKPAEFYRERSIDVALGTEVTGDRREGATGRDRGRSRHGIRQAGAGDRRRTGPARRSRRGRAPRPRAALACRRTRDHRKGAARAARGRGGRELHRARGRRVVARARARGPCRRPRTAAHGTRARPGIRRLHPRIARGARGRLSPRPDGDRDRREERHVERRNDAWRPTW